MKLRSPTVERLLHPLVGAAPVHRQIGAAEAHAAHRHAQDACDPARARPASPTPGRRACAADSGLSAGDVAVVDAELGEDARAVAALLRLRAVGVVDAHRGVEAGRRRHALEDAVGPDAGVTVADGDDARRRQLDAEALAVDDEVVVAEAVPANELVFAEHAAHTTTPMTVAAAILAGGRGKRMGGAAQGARVRRRHADRGAPASRAGAAGRRAHRRRRRPDALRRLRRAPGDRPAPRRRAARRPRVGAGGDDAPRRCSSSPAICRSSTRRW